MCKLTAYPLAHVLQGLHPVTAPGKENRGENLNPKLKSLYLDVLLSCRLKHNVTEFQKASHGLILCQSWYLDKYDFCINGPGVAIFTSDH